MAIFHFRIERMKRRDGRTPLASSAYHSDEVLLSAATGIYHRMPLRPGLIHKEIIFPPGLESDEYRDRQTLWNMAEAADKRWDACVAYLISFALPNELTDEKNIVLAREFAAGISSFTNAVCDLTVRWMSPLNLAGVIILSSREFGASGFLKKMRFGMDAKRRKSLGFPAHPIADIKLLRELLARNINEHLQNAGSNSRVDHRSLEDQGVGLIPQHHLGPIAARRLKRGEAIDRNSSSEERSVYNALLLIDETDLVTRLLSSSGSDLERNSLAAISKRYISDVEIQSKTFEFLVKNLLTKADVQDQKNELVEILESRLADILKEQRR